MEWQYKLLSNWFNEYGEKAKSISSLSIDESIIEKKNHFPFAIYKYYAPTIENVSDVSNRVLWLAPPSSFNDPKDCKMDIDEKFDKYVLEKYVANSSLFNTTEKSTIFSVLRQKSSSIHSPKIFEIISTKDLYDEVINQISQFKSVVNQYIKGLKTKDYRIACFSQFNSGNLDYSQLMWSHYAQSHKGFCVEYDIEKIFTYDFEHYSFCKIANDEYLRGFLSGSQIKKILINGFFPVVYKSKPISLPAATAFNIAKNTCCNRYLNNTQIYFLKSLITKDLIWKYEQEWRLIVDDSLIKNIGYKIPFPFAKSISVGDGASYELKSLLKDVANKLQIPIYNVL